MQIKFHSPRITRASWIPSDPMGAAGEDGVRAYYASLLAHPRLLARTRCFLDLSSGPRSGPVFHLVSLIGQEADGWAPPDVLEGDKVFFDGIVPSVMVPGVEVLPSYHKIVSLKERVRTSYGDFLIPENLPVAMWRGVENRWKSAGDREGDPFLLFDAQSFLAPVNTAYVDFILRRDGGRKAWNWRSFLAVSMAKWLDSSQSQPEGMPSQELSRLSDGFSSYGFHRWFLQKTATHLEETINLESADQAVIEAALALENGQDAGAEELLADGFAEVKAKFDALVGTPRRFFAEAHHGGMLYEDIGFFEHDWPQQVCDTISEYLGHEGSVVSLDMPANVFQFYQERFPSFFKKLKGWLEAGRLEIVNGMWGQPLTDAHTLENLLSQFLEGRQEMSRLFGEAPSIYATEEYGLGPAMPQILESVGVKRAVHAVRLGGVSKVNSPGVRAWSGPYGGRVDAIEHPDLGTPGISTGYFIALPETFANARKQNRDVVALFNLPDFGWNVLFRDEIFTALKFDAPLFKMVTFSGLFELLPKKDESVSQAYEDTYHTIFNQYTIRGKMRAYFEALRQFEFLLVAVEARAGAGKAVLPWLKSAWKDYLLGSSHDHTLVGDAPNGWYGASVAATYQGPLQLTFSRKLEEVMSLRLDEWKPRLEKAFSLDDAGRWLANLHGFPISRAVFHDGVVHQVVIAPYATVELDTCPAIAPLVLTEGNVLDNGRLRCEIDPATGSLFRVFRKQRPIWSDNRLGITLPWKAIQYSEGRLCPNPGRPGSLIHSARLSEAGKGIGWVETVYTLAPGSDDIEVDVRLALSEIPERGNYDWSLEWGRCFRYSVPNVNRTGKVVVAQSGMLMEVSPSRRYSSHLAQMIPDALNHVTSPEVIGVRAEGGEGEDAVWLFNAGFPSYFVYEDRIEQMVRMPGENDLRLRFGIGFGESEYAPVQRSRMMFAPPARVEQSFDALPVCWENPRVGLVRIEPEEGGARFWFYNFSDMEELFCPRWSEDVEATGGFSTVNSAAEALSPAAVLAPFQVFFFRIRWCKSVNDVGGAASASERFRSPDLQEKPNIKDLVTCRD